MLLKKSWNIFYCNVVERPGKLACLKSSLHNVRRFIYYTSFLNHYNFLHIKKNKKIGIIGKPRLSGILNWKIFLNK